MKIKDLVDELDELTDELDELEAIERSLDPAQDDEASGDGELSADERERMAEVRKRLGILQAFFESAPDDDALIHEDDFEDHAREVAAETCSIAFDTWPASCIDWEEAAEALRGDYTAYEIDDVTFYARA